MSCENPDFYNMLRHFQARGNWMMGATNPFTKEYDRYILSVGEGWYLKVRAAKDNESKSKNIYEIYAKVCKYEDLLLRLKYNIW